jgi:hypothetical protein
MKKIISMLLSIIALLSQLATAQIGTDTPQYAARFHYTSSNYLLTDASDSTDFIYIYPSGSFKAPKGKITNLYVATTSIYMVPYMKCYLKQWEIRLGYSSRPNFDSFKTSIGANAWPKDTQYLKDLIEHMTLVRSIKTQDSLLASNFYDGSVQSLAPPLDNNGWWVRISLTQDFVFDPSKHLVLLRSITPPSPNIQDCSIRCTNHEADSTLLKHQRILSIIKNRPYFFYNSSVQFPNLYVDLGFDLAPTAVDEVGYSQFSYRVYPNPAKEVLTIEGITALGSYEVYDMVGRQVGKGVAKDNKLPVQQLLPGSYIVQFLQKDIKYSYRFQKE